MRLTFRIKAQKFDKIQKVKKNGVTIIFHMLTKAQLVMVDVVFR